jgi:hypothetical protein
VIRVAGCYDAAGGARMNWGLIFKLSLFAAVMAVATVFVIPSKIEPAFWLVIFVVCAWAIARGAPGKYFLHGFVLALVNCLWITSGHILFAGAYLARHADEAASLAKMPAPDSPRLMMAMMGPVIGIISGLVQGLFAFVASKIVRKRS